MFYVKLYVHSLVDKFKWFYENARCYNKICSQSRRRVAEHWWVLGIDGNIILKLTLWKYGMKIWNKFLWFETVTNSRILHFHETSGSLDCVNVLDMMNDCHPRRTILLRAVVNEKLIQELFIINFIELLSLICEYFYCHTWS